MANVCETCGDKGWEESLVFCDSCKLGAVHRYCCGITPVPIDGYVTWFCSDCDESDSASESTRQVEVEETSNVEVSSSPPTMEETGTTRDKSIEKKKKKKKKKKRKIITLSVLDATVDETMEVSTKEHDGSENGKSDGSDKSGKNKKKKKKKNAESSDYSSPVPEADEGHALQGTTTSAEPTEVSTGQSDELVGLERNESSVSEKSGKKKKNKKKKTDKGEEEKKNEEGINNNHFSPVLEAEGHELQQATTSVEPVKESKKRKCSESKESEGLNKVSVLEKSAKKKKSGESSTHTSPVLDAQVLQDVTSVEAMKESAMPLNVSVGNEVSVSKKKKKKKRSEENSNHSSPVLKAVVDSDTTSVEAMKESKKNKKSVSRESDELTGSAVLEKSEKKKKKRNEESSNHTAQVLDTTRVEAMKESKKHKTSASKESVLEKSEKKKEKKNKESSNHTTPVLAAKDHVVCDKGNVKPEKAQESSASRKPTELAGLETNGASVSEGGNSTNVPPDHTSCTTSKKRRLSSDDSMQVTSVNTELPANNSSRKEAVSNIPQTNELIPALNNDRAQPFSAPVWRGSVTVKQGNVCSIHGLVAHLSTWAIPRVYEKACSLRTRLSAEMFPRLEIWPPSFLRNGPPTDDSIALYFFPSSDSNGEKDYYSLVDEMKKKDLAMRCLLDDVELLLFTSYQLPLPLWKFCSKEYLWGVFRRGKTSGH